ncbi:hypothetical protein R4K19_11010 [Pseudomonas aeruginosa]|uniref:hypothetical protein n=1 Tax=Pseudomonas aeruginosa TaxID=287 RepID=UPI0029543005|nr:hypothetical protein [Pseudomonas aeruginosa]MDV8131521.1 hypothetical protein [Pseudomonas aeruginosa]
MSEVKRYINCVIGMTGVEMVRATDYAKLAAEAQALRDERDSQQRVAIKAMEELAALRARVVVVPDAANDRRKSAHYCRGWNACLDEVARLNGKTVSEGLLREVARHLGNWLELHECECDGGFHYCGRDQVAKTNRELRALLNQDKENGNG